MADNFTSLDPALIAEMASSALRALAEGTPQEKIPKLSMQMMLKLWGHAGAMEKLQKVQSGQIDMAMLRTMASEDAIKSRASAAIEMERVKSSSRENITKIKMAGTENVTRLKEQARQDTMRLRADIAQATEQMKLRMANQAVPGSGEVAKIAGTALKELRMNTVGGKELMPAAQFAELKKVVLAAQKNNGQPLLEPLMSQIESQRANRAAMAVSESTLRLQEAFKGQEPPANLVQQIQGMARDTGTIPSEKIMTLAKETIEQQNKMFEFQAGMEATAKKYGKSATGGSAAEALPAVLDSLKAEVAAGKLAPKTALEKADAVFAEHAAKGLKSKLGWGAAIGALLLPFLLRKKEDDQPSQQEQLALMQALQGAQQQSEMHSALMNSKAASANRDQAKADLLRAQMMQLMPQMGGAAL